MFLQLHHTGCEHSIIAAEDQHVRLVGAKCGGLKHIRCGGTREQGHILRSDRLKHQRRIANDPGKVKEEIRTKGIRLSLYPVLSRLIGKRKGLDLVQQQVAMPDCLIPRCIVYRTRCRRQYVIPCC